MRLFIAEKPSVARAIAAELGVELRSDGFFKCRNDCVVTNCFGHLLELKDPDHYLPDDVPLNNKGKKMWRLEDLPIVPRQWCKAAKSDAKKQLKIIGELLKQASEVVNAGDPDREGQLLVDEVLDHFNWEGKTLRYWQSAMDPKSVQRALARLEPNAKYEPWGKAAETRSRADWLIGMNISRALTLKHHPKSVISAGRVQSTTLRLIVDRDLAIENFKSKKFYELTGQFKCGSAQYAGKWQIPDDLKDPDGYLTDLAALDQAMARMKAHSTGRISSYDQKLKAEKPKLLYTLTDLQVECSKKFGFSAKKTLSIAQELYETHKLTSYPRTSCAYLPAAQQDDVAPILTHIAQSWPQLAAVLKTADPKRKSAVWNDAKVNEEAHTGLAPTLLGITPEKLAALPLECRQVYELICRRYAAAFMPDCSYNETVITTELNSGDVFITKGRQIIDAGWRRLYSAEKTEEQEEEQQCLPVLRKDQMVTLADLSRSAKNTQPPKPFTEGTLVKAMEEIAKYVSDPNEKKLLKETSGIGTAATRAQIIERLKTVGYIKLVRSKLISTEFGRQVVNVIPKKLQSASLTANAEEDLKNIQKGSGSAPSFEAETVKLVNDMLKETMMAEEIKSGDHVEKCPKCGGNLYRNESKFKQGQFYWHCAGCRANFEDLSGKIGAERVTADCPNCGKKMSRMKSKFNDKEYIWWCGGCRTAYKDDDGKVGAKIEKAGNSYLTAECPECGKTAKRYPNKSDPSKFHWYCVECRTSFFDDDGKIGKKIAAGSR